MSYFDDKLMYDFSLSSKMKEERESGFKIKESSSSPLRGFWGSSFQKLQQMPLYSYQRMQQIIDMGSEPDLPPVIIGSDEPGEGGLVGPTGPPGNIGPRGSTGGVFGVGSTGPTGFAGLAGNQGPIGEEGAQGLIGNLGSTGYDGPQGSIGSTGPIGGGRTGDRGPRATGDIGATCTAGGCTGPQGIEGTSGEIPCDCCIGITSQTNATCEIKVLAYENIQTGPLLFDNFVLTNAGGVQKTFTATSGTQTHNNFKVQTSDEVTATNIKNMLALAGNESFTAAVTGDTVTVTQVIAGIEGNQDNEVNTILESISVTNFAGVRNDTWIKFPDPTYPGEQFDSEYDEQLERIMVGETHSFVLYFIHPTEGNREIFWPLEETQPTHADWTIISDILNHNSSLTKLQTTQHLSDYGTCGGFLAENVATEFTQNECEVLEAYRRGIGKGNTENNRIDGYGVCGCNEEQLNIQVSDVNFEGSADEFRERAATYFNKFESEIEGQNECGWYSLWGKCGWGAGYNHTGPNYANDFKTNSRGKFIVGYKTNSITNTYSYEFWHGWDSPSSEAQTNTRNCQSCEGCTNLLPDYSDCCDAPMGIVDPTDVDKCYCCVDESEPPGGGAILQGCYAEAHEGACCSDPGGEGDRTFSFQAPPGVNTDAACLEECKSAWDAGGDPNEIAGAKCITRGYHAQICETQYTDPLGGHTVTTYCTNLDPTANSDYPTIDIEELWDGSGCPESLACGLFACNGNRNWGTIYNALGNPVQLLQSPPMRMHNVEDAGCAMNSASCEQWQCCQSFSASGGDSLDYWRDHGPYGLGKNWQGGNIIPSNYGVDDEDHYNKPYCNGTNLGDGNCYSDVLDYDQGLTRGEAEEDGYYNGEFLYRPGSKGHGNPIDYWGVDPCQGSAIGRPACLELCDYTGTVDTTPGFFYLKYLISSGNNDWDCTTVKPSNNTRPKCFIAPGEYTENDYLPNGAIYDSKLEPKKPFPTLVMNGSVMADKLKEYIDGGHLSRPIPSSLLTIDINVMVLTSWAVQTPASGTTYRSGTKRLPWTLKDPWPHLAPNHKKFNDYFNTTGGALDWGINVGIFNTTSWGAADAKIYDVEKAWWHCRVGGVDISTIGFPFSDYNTYNTHIPYSNNPYWVNYTSSTEANWDECDLCLGYLRTKHPIVGGVDSDPFYEGMGNITHAGPRYNVGIPQRGYHGGHSFPGGGIGGLADLGDNVAIWDSLDNGIDNFQYHHPLNGVFVGNTAEDYPLLYNIHSTDINPPGPTQFGEIRQWRWWQGKGGPFKRREGTLTIGGEDYDTASISTNPSTHSGGAQYPRDKQISRMEEYLNDFFSFAEWTFNLNMNALDKNYNPSSNEDSDDLHEEGWKDPSYMTLTDYTINSVCIH